MAGSIILDGFVVVSCVIFTLYLIGFNNFLPKHSDNGCAMTYMYEYPQYVKISLPHNVTDQYKRYGLYAYGEGRLIEKIRGMEFNGLPILFIPGHSGSPKQVRSLASISLRKAVKSHSPFHFDFFTLNLNEEYSAVYGGVLKEQTRFVVHCINKIFSLYQKNLLPDSIVLVGHSMGGVIAKGLFLEPDFNPKLVRLVITLATPHYPVIYTDTMLYEYYNTIGPDWPSLTNSSVTLVSIGGGVKDILVRSGLTLTPDADISVVTTAVPEVWLPTDHLCILWCKQLVLVLARALFDSVNATTQQISTDCEWRKNVFAYHLVNRTAGKCFSTSQHFPKITLWNGKTHPGEWREFLIRQYTVFEADGVRTPIHIMVRMFDTRQYEKMAIAALNHEGKDWIFACKARSLYADMRVCDEAENLSNLGRIAPTRLFKHKVAYLDLKSIKSRGHQFIIIKLPPSDEPVQVQYDVHAASDRLLTPSLPHWPQFYWVNLIKSTDQGALRYTLALPDFERIWQAYRVKLTAKNCTSSMHQAVMTLRVPWNNEHVSAILCNDDTVVFPLILHTPKPVNWGSQYPEVQIYLDPDCTYSLDIQSSPADSLGQLVRIYSPQLVAYIAAILLLTLRQQLISLGTKQQCVMFHTALITGAKPYYILPLVKITSKILGSCIYPEFIETYVPVPDLVSLQDFGLDFLLLPFFLYLVAFAIIFILGLATHVSIIISGQAVKKIVLRFIGRFISQQYSDWLLLFAQKVPLLVVAFMVTLKFTACGGLALLIGTIFYYLKVCTLYEDYLEELLLAPLKVLKNKLLARWRRKTPNQQQQEQQNNDDILRDVGDEISDLMSLKGLTEINFHITLMMLWGLSALVHIASVLVWAHNFRFSTLLEPDPASGAAVVMAVCGTVLWSFQLPRCGNQINLYENIGNIMFVLATLTLVYSTVSLYNLHIILSAAFVFITAHQLHQYAASLQTRRDSVPLLVPIDDDITTTTTTNDISENSKDKDDTDSGDDDSDENDDDEDNANGDGDKKSTDSDKNKLEPKNNQSFDLDDDLSLKDIDAENISTSECDKLTPDESEISSRKDSRTSDLSVSSYEALSLTEINKSSDKH